MKTAERTRIAFQRGTPDRVPVHCWLGLPLIKKLRPAGQDDASTCFDWWIDDPMGSIVKMQQDLGLDPMITTYSQHIGEHEIWPRMLFPRPFETDTWVETFEVIGQGDGWREHSHTIRTPDGDLDYSYRTEDGFGTSCHDFLLKGDEPEKKLPALRHFPSADLYDMSVLKGMVEKVGDEAWWLHHVIGPWDMAAEIRGLVDLSMDIYDRPAVRPRPDARLHRLAEGLLPAARRDRDPLDLDERDLGRASASRRDHFREFMKPYEAECVQAAHDAGYLVSFHNCGRATLLLEDMADTGPDAIETLTSEPLVGRRRPRGREAAHRRPRLPLRRLQRAPAPRGATRRRSARRSSAASTRRWTGGGYVLRSTGPDLRREAGADRGHVRDRARARPLQLSGRCQR